MYLAPSSFGDLHNPASLDVAQKGRNLILQIAGGDAAVSYRTELEIAPYGVVRRRAYNVVSGYEEVTQYSYPDYYVKDVVAKQTQLHEQAQRKLKGEN